MGTKTENDNNGSLVKSHQRRSTTADEVEGEERTQGKEKQDKSNEERGRIILGLRFSRKSLHFLFKGHRGRVEHWVFRGTKLADNKWHTVVLNIAGEYARLTVDCDVPLEMWVHVPVFPLCDSVCFPSALRLFCLPPVHHPLFLLLSVSWGDSRSFTTIQSHCSKSAVTLQLYHCGWQCVMDGFKWKFPLAHKRNITVPAPWYSSCLIFSCLCPKNTKQMDNCAARLQLLKIFSNLLIANRVPTHPFPSDLNIQGSRFHIGNRGRWKGLFSVRHLFTFSNFSSPSCNI